MTSKYGIRADSAPQAAKDVPPERLLDQVTASLMQTSRFAATIGPETAFHVKHNRVRPSTLFVLAMISWLSYSGDGHPTNRLTCPVESFGVTRLVLLWGPVLTDSMQVIMKRPLAVLRPLRFT